MTSTKIKSDTDNINIEYIKELDVVPNDAKLIGKFNVRSNNIIVTDPIYSSDMRGCTYIIDNVLNGDWNAYTIKYDNKERVGCIFGFWPYNRVKSLIAYHNNIKIDDIEWERGRYVGNDTGEIGIFDLEMFNQKTKYDFYRITNNDELAGIAEIYNENTGICEACGTISSSGWGDGTYDVYICKSNEDIVGLLVDYITDFREHIKLFVPYYILKERIILPLVSESDKDMVIKTLEKIDNTEDLDEYNELKIIAEKSFRALITENQLYNSVNELLEFIKGEVITTINSRINWIESLLKLLEDEYESFIESGAGDWVLERTLDNLKVWLKESTDSIPIWYTHVDNIELGIDHAVKYIPTKLHSSEINYDIYDYLTRIELCILVIAERRGFL